jgi:tight adherence protein B
LVIFRLYALNAQSRLDSRLNTFVEGKKDGDEQPSQARPSRSYFQSGNLSGLRGRINRALSFFSSDELSLKITSANWPISDIEFIFSRFMLILVGLFLGWIISRSIIGGLGLAVLFYFIPGIFLDQSILKRRKKFQEQLVDFLILIKGAIMVGSSLPQAIRVGVKEIPAPISEEFTQVLREITYGLTLSEALHNLEARMQSDDLKIVVTGIILNSQMGGSLSTILEAAIITIRDRIQLFGEVRSLSAYSRFVGLLLTFLPFIAALFLYLLSPGYFDSVKTSPFTQIILLAALLGVILGNFFIRRIIKIRI